MKGLVGLGGGIWSMDAAAAASPAAVPTAKPGGPHGTADSPSAASSSSSSSASVTGQAASPTFFPLAPKPQPQQPQQQLLLPGAGFKGGSVGAGVTGAGDLVQKSGVLFGSGDGGLSASLQALRLGSGGGERIEDTETAMAAMMGHHHHQYRPHHHQYSGNE